MNAEPDTAIRMRARGLPESHVSPSVRVVTSIEGIRSLKAEYEHLYKVTGNTLPFSLQDWHLSWCSCFLNRNSQIEEQPLFCALRDGRGECFAIVPFILSRRHCGPVKLVTAALLGGDPGLTEIRSPLIRPGCERVAVRAVHEYLRQVGDWDWIQWSRIGAALAEAMHHEAQPQWLDSNEAFVLPLPSSWEEFRAGWGRNVRESIRHCYNSLRRGGHAFEFIVARERAAVQRALERLLELHTMRANMPWGTQHPNQFASESLREFLYDVCDRLAASDAVRLFQLRIAGKIVASRIGFVVGDGLYLYYSGFDPAWAGYSVMTTTVVETFRYAIEQGLKSVNLSLTAEQSKLRWRPYRVPFRTALVRSELIRSRILYRAYRAALSSNGAPLPLLKHLWAQRRWE